MNCVAALDSRAWCYESRESCCAAENLLSKAKTRGVQADPRCEVYCEGEQASTAANPRARSGEWAARILPDLEIAGPTTWCCCARTRKEYRKPHQAGVGGILERFLLQAPD